MSREQVDRRRFLALTGSAALGALAACGSGGRPQGTGTTTPTPTRQSPTGSPSPAVGPVWLRLPATGPEARRDHSFTGDPARRVAYLFGGRAEGASALGDFWAYDIAAGRWSRVAAKGPGPRFGHNAVVLGGKLVVFGGQSGPGAFLDDLWQFDPATQAWTRLPGAGPAARYGAGGTEIDGSLLVTHGFTDSGRFDDTWSWAQSWRDVSPASGPRPVKRCLHRIAWWPAERTVALFGGQTNSKPFLDDFWLYDPAARAWTESPSGSPGARTLFGFAGLGDRLYLYGGNGPDGPIGDLQTLDPGRSAWRAVEPAGPAPEPRQGIEAAVVADDAFLVFGGRGAAGHLADLWQLTAGV